MKVIFGFLAICWFVSPLMGAVSLYLVDNGDLTIDLVMVCDGDDLDANGSARVAGLALDFSVSEGVIVDVFNYKTTGESVVVDRGYGIFPGTITFTGGTPEEIASTGTPVAPASAPDMPGQIGSSAIVLEFCALYDQAVPQAAPDATTVLCTIAITKYCAMTVAANAQRGGVVMTGGGAPSSTNLPLIIPGPPDPPEPDCRSFPCFENGDSNGDCQITFSDVSAVIAAWPPNPYAPCADFNKDGAITFSDVSVLIAHWPPNPGCSVACEPIR
ncbi:MAG: hypothetical protein IH624_16470 [Phycisphaerae bacterium]|nr:hypothetical protein [Phycisphaerae bacterium]